MVWKPEEAVWVCFQDWRVGGRCPGVECGWGRGKPGSEVGVWGSPRQVLSASKRRSGKRTVSRAERERAGDGRGAEGK